MKIKINFENFLKSARWGWHATIGVAHKGEKHLESMKF